MDYITAEQFLQQSEKVQNVLMNWWKPKTGDIIQVTNDKTEIVLEISPITRYVKTVELKSHRITRVPEDMIVPDFTETQLRHFIEDITGNIIKVIQYHPYDNEISKEGYEIDLLDIKHVRVTYCYQSLGKDLLQAYWQVACKIAKSIS